MQVAVLSPHRDDAAFSCGLTLHNLLEAGSNLTIVNVCTISNYAPYSIETSGDPTRCITELRRDEDVDFVEKLPYIAGAKCGHVRVVDLEWQDVPLRWCMEDEQALAPLSLPSMEVEELRRTFRALPSFDIVLIPMALGGHIDHRLVQDAAGQAFPASSFVFYEDLPYACRMSPVKWTSMAIQPDAPFLEEWLPVQGSTAGLKRKYALCYPSQIAVDVAEEMEKYAMKHGGRERFLAAPETMHRLKAALRHEAGL